MVRTEYVENLIRLAAHARQHRIGSQRIWERQLVAAAVRIERQNAYALAQAAMVGHVFGGAP
jgi:molybdopterin synthase catalytic subunit